MPNAIAELRSEPTMLRTPFDPLDPGTWPIAEGDVLARRADGAEGLGANSLRLCILGEPASKANSREIVMFGKRPAVIKSKKARWYEKNAIPQVIFQARAAGWKCRATGKMRVTMTIYYASERPDLDESVVLDVMQQIVYGNDRQVREKHITHAVDRDNPRTEVLIEAIQGDLL
jgi:Holliday junction resolvase RusA-like endonuclease